MLFPHIIIIIYFCNTFALWTPRKYLIFVAFWNWKNLEWYNIMIDPCIFCKNILESCFYHVILYKRLKRNDYTYEHLVLQYHFSILLKTWNCYLFCRELLLDFYRTSKQRKPKQIIIFRYYCIMQGDFSFVLFYWSWTKVIPGFYFCTIKD